MDEAYRKWLASRSPCVRAVAERFDPDICYRRKEDDGRVVGHYTLYSFSEPQDPAKPVTAVIIHGRDSFLPGFAIYGIDPDNLVVCGCGKWEFPTKEQQEIADRDIENLDQSRMKIKDLKSAN